jgi:hypothetical protein
VAGLLFPLVQSPAAEEKANQEPPPSRSLQSQKYAVRASAGVRKDPPQIELQWPAAECLSYVVYRRFFGERQWSPAPAAVLKGDAVSFVDNKVKPGVQYEYRIDKFAPGFVGRGYICSGIELPLVEDRGAVLLLVEAGIAAALDKELRQLERDLVGDCWRVIRQEVSRDDPVEKVSKLIREAYRHHQADLKTLFLFGHIPVPYSGSINPDGHKNHLGAWPADLVYADVDGEWTDKEKHETFDRGKQGNVPGDGKFDQDTIGPNSLELEVGRVDLADMPAFKLGETELLRRYLGKNHDFRHGRFTPLAKGLIDDNFGAFRGEAFGWGAWSNFAAFFGDGNIDDKDWFSTLPKTAYLWAYGCGGGSNHKANGVGFTKDFAEKGSRAVFTLLFGSYFGDWDHPDNFLRAPLAAEGHGLACAWDGRPHWFFHPMAMGGNIGNCALRTQANNFHSDYLGPDNTRLSLSGKDDDSEWEPNPVHVALMGDPTLRLHVVPPPTKVSLAKTDGGVEIKWQAPSGNKILPDGNLSYLVYRAASVGGRFEKLTETPIRETRFLDPSKPGGAVVYLVKTYAVTSSASGTYFNTSQGVFVEGAEGSLIRK